MAFCLPTWIGLDSWECPPPFQESPPILYLVSYLFSAKYILPTSNLCHVSLWLLKHIRRKKQLQMPCKTHNNCLSPAPSPTMGWPQGVPLQSLHRVSHSPKTYWIPCRSWELEKRKAGICLNRTYNTEPVNNCTSFLGYKRCMENTLYYRVESLGRSHPLLSMYYY